MDDDFKWKIALMEHNKICNKFDEFLKRNKSNILARNFYDFWPIFKSQELEEMRLFIHIKKLIEKI
jgi:hypothetical protein